MKIVHTHPCKIGFSANAGKIVYAQNLSGSLFLLLVTWKFPVRSNKQKILNGTSVFIPITVSYNAIGSNFEGDIVEDEIQLRATAGYFLLVNRFPRSRYRIEFGSEGPSDYSFRSVYDITVYPDGRKNLLIYLEHQDERSAPCHNQLNFYHCHWFKYRKIKLG